MIQPTNLYIVTRTCIIPFQFLLEIDHGWKYGARLTAIELVALVSFKR